LFGTEEPPERWKVIDDHVATGEKHVSETIFPGTIEHTNFVHRIDDIIAPQPGAAGEIQTFK
jgi:hypothetical protein|tara:strand:+ start:1034 stop:1219 length:186 start_codon:yes stop_codon:yes gene_type:complete